MHELRDVLARLKGFFIPHEGNRFRPQSLSRDALIVVVAVTCVVEGFLLTSLFMQSGAGQFAAAVLKAAVVNLTNAERSDLGLGELRADPALTAAAQAKADDMARRGYFSHNDPDGSAPWKWVLGAGYDYAYAGENLAVRFYDSSDVVQAWMQSPSHRANIAKSAYRDIGIGVAEGTYEGKPTTFVVQFFGTSRAALGIAPASAATAPRAQAPTDVSEPGAEEVAPEEILESAPVSAELAAAVPTQPTVGGQSTQIPASIVKLFNSPRTMALSALSAILALLIVALGLATFIRMRIQPVDMLLSGAVVAAFVFSIFALNNFVLIGATVPPSTPAAAIEAVR